MAADQALTSTWYVDINPSNVNELIPGTAVPTISFTPALQRFVGASAASVEATTLNQALAAVFAGQPKLRGYVLDDQGALRRHVAIYVNGEPVRDRIRLSDPVSTDDDVYVFQALSGG